MVTRNAIVTAARNWLGTPYHHQASLRGAGADCLGLIRGVWRELYGEEPEPMPPYTPDWGSATGSETLLAAASRHLVKLDGVGEARPGDVLVFRMRDRGVAKHAGILTLGDGSGCGLIHAQEGLGVVEITLGLWWRRRAVAAFSFPGVDTTSPLWGEVGAQRTPGEGADHPRSPSHQPFPQRGEGESH
ncbi:peptidase P60 [Methyloceanibacter sp.]|uniref:peptidase P60 n=1 Tax=Methyloceanibacter sp. TaxID=1965321 RepID=UPI002D43217C|nr:peptidase P60 [Methyloceanibacter sp.]HZP10290.1 peptidase P60 [Methyloceanibacter sp.]